ncbi:MAG TPA: response regulator [Bacteroidetes bacterium]|nr:response regulator [Bacteroidota bacterium]HDZ12297.1 response regulator [Bacteroidota bacterium]
METRNGPGRSEAVYGFTEETMTYSSKGNGMSEQTVLLVEDNPDHAEIITRVLRKMMRNLNIRLASDGQQALEILGLTQSAKPVEKIPTPKIILLDIRLPKIDGTEVLKIIKASPALKKIPVIVLTTSERKEEVKKMYALGANSYIVKPGKFEDFMGQLKKLRAYLEDYTILGSEKK